MRGVNSKYQEHGFTIVELLIVIVVIAILAAITIVAYNGVTKRAIETTMQSDLRNAADGVEIDKTTSGKYPANAQSANGGSGLRVSGSNQLTYLGGNNGNGPFCIQASNPRTSTVYHVLSTDLSIAAGSCGIWVTTLAGGTSGCVDGIGSAARFGWDYGIAVGNGGTVYVASTGCTEIRTVASNGTVTTLAGSGTSGFADGTGAAAQFSYPYKLAVDVSGNVYVGDSNNQRVRKITSAGVVSTFAGSGTTGSADGTGTAAQFNGPGGVAFDTSGNLYVIEGIGRLRKITPGGVVTTIAGSGTSGYVDGTGAAAQFKSPQALAIDSSGTIFVADTNNQRIRKVTSGGVVTTFAGSSIGSADGTGAAAQFNYPTGIAVDSSGNVYVADSGNNSIRKITSTGIVSTLAGSSSSWNLVDGPAGTGQLNNPVDVAVDGTGALYVMDNGNFAVRRINQ